MNPDVAPPGPGRWLPVRDRVTGRLLCEYDPHAGLIRVRRNRRYYTAPLPPAPVLGDLGRQRNPTPEDNCPEGAPALWEPCPEEVPTLWDTCPEGIPALWDTCPKGIPALWELIEAAHRLLHRPGAACPEDPDHDRPAP